VRCLGVGIVLVLATCVAAVAAAGLPVRPATPADGASRATTGTYHEWWTIRATNPATGDFVYVRLYDRPTPSLEVEFRAGAQQGGAFHPALTVEPHTGPGVSLARVPDQGAPDAVTLTGRGRTFTFDSAYPSALAHLVLRSSARGITAGPWQLGPEPVGGPPATLVPGRMQWSVQVPAGAASGSLTLDGRHVDLAGWSAYVDHVWGSFGTWNWFHGDFALTATPTATWALYGLEPGSGDRAAYRWTGTDARWRGVLVHTVGGRAVACSARVARAGWQQIHPLGESYTYRAPTVVRASCGGTTHTFGGARPGTDSLDGVVRTGGPTHDGMLVHLTPQFG
jgi:hypothetical protein